jgi:hypothetical protein
MQVNVGNSRRFAAHAHDHLDLPPDGRRVVGVEQNPAAADVHCAPVLRLTRTVVGEAKIHGAFDFKTDRAIGHFRDP